MATCKECNHTTRDLNPHFCSNCGKPIPEEETLPFVGVDADRGIFRITFPPQEEEFSHGDAVRDAIRRATVDGEQEFQGNPKIEFLRSTVTPKTHPFGCGSCKKGKKYMRVSETDKGRCEDCGEVKWERRK